jgi:hypothetical protein
MDRRQQIPKDLRYIKQLKSGFSPAVVLPKRRSKSSVSRKE